MDLTPFKKFALVSLSAAVLTACGSNPTQEETSSSASTAGSSTASETAGSSATTAGTGESSGVNGQAMTGQSTDSMAENAMSEASAAKDAAMTALTVFYFDFDKSEVKGPALDALKAHAAYLKVDSGAKVNLAGHADERGTREYNLALGERRGKAIAQVLMSEGVASSQIEVISYGEEKPADFSNHAKNRRVELSY
ncbi:OmpA family protein [Litoribrevibacter euphylliae]|uniref:OmpA family protein n=1 Tax=Litoribrevibacter euphylliae TaxID=1834034 RepID=A0ABV7H9G1_9GAMM